MKEFVSWEIDVPVIKAYRTESGKMHVVAVASDDELDLQRDAMTASALNKMADQAKAGVPLLDNHRSTFEFGRSITGHVVNKDGRMQFMVDLELDGDFPQARKLFKEVQDGSCNRQLSIGGKLNLKNKSAISIEMTQKGLVRKIHDLDLDHIACTRNKQAANPRTGFVAAICKSIEEQGGWEGVKVEKDGLPGQQVVNQEPDTGDQETVTGETGTRTGTKTSTESGSATGSGTEVDAEDAVRGAGILAMLGRMFKGKTRTGGERMSELRKQAPAPGAPVDDDKDTTDDKDTKDKKTVGKDWPGLDSGSKSDSDTDTDTDSDSDDSKDSDSKDSDDSSSSSSSSSDSGSDTTAAKVMVKKEEDDKKDTEDEVTPEEEEAAKVLMRQRLNKKDEDVDLSEEELVREISILLSKDNVGGMDANERDAVKGALWNIRYLLAKSYLTKEDAGDSAVGAVASSIADAGPWAPRDLSAAANGFADDKAAGDAAVGQSGVTDHRHLPVPGGEVASTAPDSAAQLAALKSAKAAADSLPQGSDVAQFGKSLLEKSVEMNGDMILKAVEAISGKFEDALKGFDDRIARIESVTAPSQSGPRGGSDVVKGKGASSVWGGLFSNAASQATRGM